MKKNMLIIGLVIFTFFSCKTTFDQTLLRPTDGSISPRLPRLELQEQDNEISYAQGKQVTSNSKMYTLFERELDNICKTKGDYKGYIQPIVTINEVSMGYGFYVLSAFTLFTINIVGVPMYTNTIQLEVEFEIKDINKDKVWKKIYYKKKKIYVGFYYNANKRMDELTLGLYREMLKEFKHDLQRDSKEITKSLLES